MRSHDWFQHYFKTKRNETKATLENFSSEQYMFEFFYLFFFYLPPVGYGIICWNSRLSFSVGWVWQQVWWNDLLPLWQGGSKIHWWFYSMSCSAAWCSLNRLFYDVWLSIQLYSLWVGNSADTFWCTAHYGYKCHEQMTHWKCELNIVLERLINSCFKMSNCRGAGRNSSWLNINWIKRVWLVKWRPTCSRNAVERL